MLFILMLTIFIFLSGTGVSFWSSLVWIQDISTPHYKTGPYRGYPEFIKTDLTFFCGLAYHFGLVWFELGNFRHHITKQIPVGIILSLSNDHIFLSGTGVLFWSSLVWTQEIPTPHYKIGPYRGYPKLIKTDLILLLRTGISLWSSLNSRISDTILENRSL